MEKLDKDALFLIARELDLLSLLKLCKTDKRMNKICAKDDVWYYILNRDYDKPEVKYRLTDEILLKFPKITALYAFHNPKITDKSVKELKNLQTLDAR